MPGGGGVGLALAGRGPQRGALDLDVAARGGAPDGDRGAGRGDRPLDGRTGTWPPDGTGSSGGRSTTWTAPADEPEPPARLSADGGPSSGGGEAAGPAGGASAAPAGISGGGASAAPAAGPVEGRSVAGAAPVAGVVPAGPAGADGFAVVELAAGCASGSGGSAGIRSGSGPRSGSPTGCGRVAPTAGA